MNAILTPDPDDADEVVEYETRLGILMDGAQREPTQMEISMAVEDVKRFRTERVD